MSLSLVRRPGSTQWYVRGTVRRQSVFESTGTADRERAEAYRARREGELWDRAVHGARAVVTFAHAVVSYLEAAPRSPATVGYVTKLVAHFGTTKLQAIDQTALDRAYHTILTPRAGAATKLRAVLTPLRAILEHAAIRGWCNRPAFERLAQPKSVTPFLRPAQVIALVQHAPPHLKPLLVFLVGTGCRMSEALDLTWDSVDLRGGRATVWQKQGNERDLDLPPVVVAALSALPERTGALFRPILARTPRGQKRGKTRGLRYRDTGRAGGGQIKTAWARACRDAGLPGGWRVWTPKGSDREKRVFVPAVSPHCLRHTWATWQYCLDADLVALRDRGGWSTITMVTRYAKRMPIAYRGEIEAWLAGGVEEAKKTG